MEAANAAQNRKHSLGPVCRQVRSSRHFFFLEMLFVTGPFRGREVHTWHKLTSLMLPVAVLDVWAPFVHPIIQT